MLRISVFQFKGEPPVAPLSCEFNEGGGTIGRDSSNALPLPDPERHMSRVQAEVQFVDGGYLLVDHGSNPTTVNGLPVGKGNSTPLRDGDEVGIAFYSMRVELKRSSPAFSAPARAPAPSPQAAPQPDVSPLASSGSAGSDPLGLFAPSAPVLSSSAPASDDLFGSLGIAASAPPASASPAAPQNDPFALLGGASQPAAAPASSAAASDDPFAVFAAKPVTPAQPVAPARRSSPAASDDPFAAFGARPKAAEPAPSALGIDLPGDALGMGLQASEPSSLDSLFSLDTKSRSQDPFAGSALGDPLFGAASSITSSDDPLALLSGSGPAAPAAERNDASIMHEAFVPPKVLDSSPVAPPAAARKVPPASPPIADMTASAKPRAGVVSWEETPAPPAAAPKAAVFKEPAQPLADAPVAPRAKVQVAAEGAEKAPPAVASAAPAPAVTSAALSDADTAELLNALARGLGVNGLKPNGGLTPEFMEHVGKMLREAAHGTIELLLARAVTKREVRAEMTMIVSKNNNPLKFSPDVNFALMQLIAPQGQGFMPPVEAMRDAYDDLRAHQIGFMAGMRGALTGVLARFKPDDLEARLTDKSFLDSVLPGNRKAKLWDLYEQRFADISREAEDNFHAFFGREFLKAYEEQLDRLHDDRN